MKYSPLILLIAVFTFSKNVFAEKVSYGSKISVNNGVSIETTLQSFSKYKNKEFVMKARVDKVCKSKGCWMILKSTKSDIRVKFKDYSFFVPLSLINKEVLVKGNIKRVKLTTKATKHYLKDAGASARQLDMITKPSFEYNFIASGVKVISK